jgi:hypothetical protein
MQQQLVMGDDRALNEAVGQVLELEARKAIADSSARLRVVRAAMIDGSRALGGELLRAEYTSSVGMLAILAQITDRNDLRNTFRREVN